MTPTPLKQNCEFDQKALVTPYSAFKDQYSKIGMPHFMPFNILAKDSQFKQSHNESFDSQLAYEEICGKKRARSQYLGMQPP
jgi:hypothetical protein